MHPELNQIQPAFDVLFTNLHDGLQTTGTVHSATLLHRIAVESKSFPKLKGRLHELTPELVNNTDCWVEHKREDGSTFILTQVRKGKKTYPTLNFMLPTQISPIFFASLSSHDGNAENVLALLQAGASPDTSARFANGHLVAPIHNAAWHSSPDCAQALIDAGANIIGMDYDFFGDKMNPEVAQMIKGRFDDFS